MISVASHGEGGGEKLSGLSYNYVMKRLVVGTCAVVIKIDSATSLPFVWYKIHAKSPN